MWMMARVIGGVVATLVMASGVRAQTLAPACPLQSQAAGMNAGIPTDGDVLWLPRVI
jgi:hypothetical protein